MQPKAASDSFRIFLRVNKVLSQGLNVISGHAVSTERLRGFYCLDLREAKET